MSQATLTFTLPDEQADFEKAVQASAAFAALEAIRNEVFRPARKHGYGNEDIQALLRLCGMHDEGAGEALIAQLEKLFYAILDDHGIVL